MSPMVMILLGFQLLYVNLCQVVNYMCVSNAQRTEACLGSQSRLRVKEQLKKPSESPDEIWCPDQA